VRGSHGRRHARPAQPRHCRQGDYRPAQSRTSCAAGAEPRSGDGAGILIQVPDAFLREVVEFELPEPDSYATGIAFLPQSSKDAAAACAAVEKIAESEGLQVLGWRNVPIDDSSLGALSRDAMPTFRQVFLTGESG